MSIDWYISHGFTISSQISEDVLKRAEDNIKVCYLEPIIDGVEEYDADLYDDALANLTFLLLAQENVNITRAGAVTKETNESNTVKVYDISPAYYQLCYSSLYRFCVSAGKDCFPKMNDVCQLFYKSNFFYI